MFNRQLVSSAESFWNQWPGQALADPSLEVLEAARITGSALSRLSQELRDELGDGKDHPKIAATVRWVASRMNSVPRHHILVFCVFDATRRSPEAALKKKSWGLMQLPARAAEIPKHLAERFMKEPQDGSDPLVMIVQDRFSESIDLDGGNPYLVHHDLPWNPARISQRWGRVV